jgi:hypothetical protein
MKTMAEKDPAPVGREPGLDISSAGPGDKPDAIPIRVHYKDFRVA